MKIGKGVYYIFLLILAYLLLVHYAGFSKDIGAVSNLGGNWFKTLQGPPAHRGE